MHRPTQRRVGRLRVLAVASALTVSAFAGAVPASADTGSDAVQVAEAADVSPAGLSWSGRSAPVVPLGLSWSGVRGGGVASPDGLSWSGTADSGGTISTMGLSWSGR